MITCLKEGLLRAKRQTCEMCLSGGTALKETEKSLPGWRCVVEIPYLCVDMLYRSNVLLRSCYTLTVIQRGSELKVECEISR